MNDYDFQTSKEAKDWLKILAKTLPAVVIIVSLLLFFSGCKMTERGAQRKVHKVHVQQRNVLSVYCAEYNPIKIDSLIEVIEKWDTLYVQGDSVFVDCLPDTVIRRVAARCPSNLLITKTVTNNIVKMIENRAAADSARASSIKFREESIKQESSKKIYRNMFFAACGLLVAAIALLVYVIKFKPKDLIK